MLFRIQESKWLADLSDEQQEIIAGGESNSAVNVNDFKSLTTPESAKILGKDIGLTTAEFLEEDSERKLISNSQPMGSLSVFLED
ncbi:hypothetical protein [Mastigocoleus testarum]|uniref:Bacteriocin n=1 Tax=Mastigocoleus testarum BC008 TaxID=371196 RepID=A0A0V8A0A6_9CYAN|nr:hypothetical protein [Mastigocoleus testarum]KST66872.1 hypothetical protein BC008_27175 [Mastigocoleus testarum BC008]KST70210.1 hypothetical protein BC008_36780 [Mastigocoleus testarum BC008]